MCFILTPMLAKCHYKIKTSHCATVEMMNEMQFDNFWVRFSKTVDLNCQNLRQFFFIFKNFEWNDFFFKIIFSTVFFISKLYIRLAPLQHHYTVVNFICLCLFYLILDSIKCISSAILPSLCWTFSTGLQKQGKLFVLVDCLCLDFVSDLSMEYIYIYIYLTQFVFHSLVSI